MSERNALVTVCGGADMLVFALLVVREPEWLCQLLILQRA
jgi:hypothetical protein